LHKLKYLTRFFYVLTDVFSGVTPYSLAERHQRLLPATFNSNMRVEAAGSSETSLTISSHTHTHTHTHIRGGTQIFPEFEFSAKTRHSSGFCH